MGGSPTLNPQQRFRHMSLGNVENRFIRHIGTINYDSIPRLHPTTYRMRFAGNSIRLGDYAGLSPIDITIFESQSRTSEGVQLAAIDSFMDFARGARTKMEEALEAMDRTASSSTVDSDLLVQMVKEVGALRVGKYYRERSLTGHYAQILLDAYMFASLPDGKDRRNGVIQHFYSVRQRTSSTWITIFADLGI